MRKYQNDLEVFIEVAKVFGHCIRLRELSNVDQVVEQYIESIFILYQTVYTIIIADRLHSG